MKKTTTRGPRPGRPDTRETIRAAARARFIAEGYDAVTMRSVASDAGVDVALVSYYFASKSGLFGAAMELAVNPAEVFAATLPGEFDTLAERALRTMLTVWDSPIAGPQLRTMAIAASAHTELGPMFVQVIQTEIVDRLVEHLGGGPEATARAAAFQTVMAGVVFTRHVLRVGPLATMTVEEIVARLAPSLQLALGPQPPGSPVVAATGK
jgi:AcrR family transcriptional regulator